MQWGKGFEGGLYDHFLCDLAFQQAEFFVMGEQLSTVDRLILNIIKLVAYCK